jgi:hypothetical protein
MQSSLELSDFFIIFFIAAIFSLGVYTIVKFMRSKD